jgi:CubicO group peptidase (beta-lactamase class C family)
MEAVMKNPALCAVLLLLLPPAVSWGSEPDPLATILEEQIPKLMRTADIPGLSIAVVRDGRLSWSGAFGVRSRDTLRPVNEQTMFEAASLSKTVTAVAALKLVEQGRLSLDRPLAEYLPYPRLAGDDRYRKLTARHVLTHTTGLPNWGNEFLRGPGELFGYSGEGFLYLGRSIAAITGMSLDELAR